NAAFGRPGSAHSRLERAEALVMDAMTATILVIGLGNPILGDDGVGWCVVRRLAQRLVGDERVEVDCLSVGGLSLMERMLGYRHVILVDAIDTGRSPQGTIRVFDLNSLDNPALGHSTSAHDASLKTALATAKAMGGDVPDQVDIVSVEARVGLDFTESLTYPIAAAVSGACDHVLALINP
ncbi:MAG TPA: hydrogenase maturation protease, partial [Anaerolineales bacterium]|nr:hydrogenase maturation protease [Anaerolineales bacterium]